MSNLFTKALIDFSLESCWLFEDYPHIEQASKCVKGTQLQFTCCHHNKMSKLKKTASKLRHTLHWPHTTQHTDTKMCSEHVGWKIWLLIRRCAWLPTLQLFQMGSAKHTVHLEEKMFPRVEFSNLPSFYFQNVSQLQKF